MSCNSHKHRGQRVSGKFLKLIQKNKKKQNRVVKAISKIIRVEFFRVGNVIVVHGTELILERAGPVILKTFYWN